jgi:hypothetical protein
VEVGAGPAAAEVDQQPGEQGLDHGNQQRRRRPVRPQGSQCGDRQQHRPGQHRQQQRLAGPSLLADPGGRGVDRRHDDGCQPLEHEQQGEQQTGAPGDAAVAFGQQRPGAALGVVSGISPHRPVIDGTRALDEGDSPLTSGSHFLFVLWGNGVQG